MKNRRANAIQHAKKPNLDRLFSQYPHVLVRTSGMDVGLPRGQMGNSEVGHTNIGAGRIVYQELTRITKAIEDGPFFENAAFLAAIDNCKRNHSKLHLYGLLSDGGVHSHNTHLYALLELAKRQELTEVFVHCFFDGRDVPPDSALGLYRRIGSETPGDRRRQNRLHYGPVLCHGSRQPLGTRSKSLRRDGPRRRRFGGRRLRGGEKVLCGRRDGRVCRPDGHHPRRETCGGDWPERFRHFFQFQTGPRA